MDSQSLYGPVKALAMVILLLMLVSLLYAAYISVTHWKGIGV